MCQNTIGQNFTAIPQSNKTSTSDEKRLGVGDKVPDFRFNELINFRATSGHLSDFRADLTILDFWSTSCSVCVDQFANMQRLKDRFGPRLQIILLNSQSKLWHDDAPKVTNLLKHYRENTGIAISLPVVLNATAVDEAFPHNSMPHEVWIDKNGVVVAITGHLEVTRENIGAALEGKVPKMHVKDDAHTNFENTTLQEWYTSSSHPNQSTITSSIIVKGFIDGGNGEGVRRDPANSSKFTGWFCINRPLFYLFYDAYNNKITVPWNQVLYEGPDSALFSKKFAKDSSFYSRDYSYDITVPPSSFEEIRTYVQEDLKRAFGYVVKNGKKRMNCLVIRIGPHPKLSDPTAAKRWEMEENSKNNGVRNHPLLDVLLTLNRYSSIPMLLPEGSQLKLDIKLPANIKDAAAVRQSLQNAGLILSEEKRLVDVAIITKNP